MSLIAQFQDYVAQMTGARVQAQPLVSGRLPQYLSQNYELYQLSVDDRLFLGIVLRDPDDFQPSRFKKHLPRLIESEPTASHPNDYCLIADALSSYARQRLVERRIPFVVPEHQMNWPALGAAVQARGSRIRPLTVAGNQLLMPATQVVILYALNEGVADPVTPNTLAARLGYTRMTMSRTLDEIEAEGLGRVIRKGRERLLDFPEGRKRLWELSEGRLRNPIRQTIRVRERHVPKGDAVRAGESALADFSLLGEPREPIVAVGRKAWKPLAKTVERVPIPEDDTFLVQVWRYDPGLLGRHGRVDPFSLYLSLREEPDERVQIALGEMMEENAW